MCGIVGYVGPREATPILIEGLAALEYRIALQLKPDLAAAQRQLDEALEQGRRPAAD